MQNTESPCNTDKRRCYAYKKRGSHRLRQEKYVFLEYIPAGPVVFFGGAALRMPWPCRGQVFLLLYRGCDILNKNGSIGSNQVITMKKSRDLKYLFITRTLTGGGAERFVATFASFMAEQGYDVHVLTYEISDKDYPLSGKVKRHVMPFVEDNARGKFLRLLRMLQALTKINADVLIPFIGSVVYCTYLANLLLGKKLVFTVRNSPWRVASGRFAQLIAKKADAIMLQNEEQAEFYPESYGKRIYIVPNPVSDKFRICRKEQYAQQLTNISAVGRLHPQKNFPLLLSAVKTLRSAYPDIRLRIYGDGEEQKALEELIGQWDLTDACRLMGRTSDVEAVLKETDLFVMSSDYEGMPNALIEALAMGVPCISSDCRTGPRSLIHDGQTGLLFKTGDLESLTEKMTWALQHPEEMNQMGRAAREDILQTYQIERTLSSFMEMIRGLYNEKHV